MKGCTEPYQASRDLPQRPRTPLYEPAIVFGTNDANENHSLLESFSLVGSILNAFAGGRGRFQGNRHQILRTDDNQRSNWDNALGDYMKTQIQFVLSVLFCGLSIAAAPPSTQQSPVVQLGHAAADNGLLFLKAQQKPDNSWQTEADPPGISAIVLRAFIADDKYDADIPFVEKGFDKLLSYQLENGGIYKDVLAGYNTAIAISALATSKEAEYRAAIQKALVYLHQLQWTDSIAGVSNEVKVDSDKDAKFGGFGYGKRSRPDMSNTQMALDALHDAGVKSDDPAFVAAMKFVTRCQNNSETNDQAWAGNDGGFIYSPADGGVSNAGEYMIGGRRMLRSYGSMTYAGLKSMIYAGLSHDDPRVKSAWDWISKNFTVDENPGMAALGPDEAQGGIYYYYYTMARALSAYGQPIITDPQGNKHDWRVELIKKIATLQRPDGSFVGQRKWMEDNSILVTSYTVIALEEAMKDLKEHPATAN
jgi:squalene-hopene/tetraprenyl-beta-curcumene cyclase